MCTQRMVVNSNGCFRTTYRSPLQGPRNLLDFCRWDRYIVLEDGNYRLPGTSVCSYHSTERNVPKEHRSHLYRYGSFKSHRFGGIWEKMGLNLGQVIAQNKLCFRGFSKSQLADITMHINETKTTPFLIIYKYSFISRSDVVGITDDVAKQPRYRNRYKRKLNQRIFIQIRKFEGLLR